MHTTICEDMLQTEKEGEGGFAVMGYFDDKLSLRQLGTEYGLQGKTWGWLLLLFS